MEEAVGNAHLQGQINHLQGQKNKNANLLNMGMC